MKTGRPSKFKPEFKEQAAKLAEFGLTDKQMASYFNVTEQTFNNWKNDFPDFFDALKDSKEYADAQVEASLFKKATGYDKDDKHYPPDTTACIFWLKNRKSEEWRDVKERINKYEEEPVSELELARRIAFLLTKGVETVGTKLN